jgi:hypothetical protein
METVRVIITKLQLTDDGHVFDVRMGDFVFPAVDAEAAEKFADKVKNAIEDYTLSEATIERV